MSTRKKTRSKAGGNSSLKELSAYLEESRRPLAILWFLLPFVGLYELSTRFFHQVVGADQLLRFAASFFSVYGRGVPAVLLILTLLGWHLFKRDRWKVRILTLGGMLVESLLLALPVLAIAYLCQRYIRLYAISSNSSLAALWAISLGAGVYEELLFRFYGVGLLRLVIEFLLNLKPPISTILIILISSVLFSLYHYMGAEHFLLRTFIFRTLAGAYFAWVFLYRGLGVTAGSHAIYDLIVVTMSS